MDTLVDSESKPYKNNGSCVVFCAQFVRLLGSIVGTLIVGTIGAALQRIEGGWLEFPTIETDTNWKVLVTGLTTRLFLVAGPVGILIIATFHEKKKHDPFNMRRIALALVATIFVWFALYVDVSTYEHMGRYPAPNTLPVGVFDWLIGHECKGITATRSWFHELLGMSLLGFLYTVPTGSWLYCFGYGWEFLLSGCVIGAIYELGHSFPPSGFEGIEVAQALWGAWFWMVLVVSILGRIKTHRRPQVPFLNKKKMYLWELF